MRAIRRGIAWQTLAPYSGIAKRAAKISLLSAAAWTAVTLPSTLGAQTPEAAAPAFDVATIKPSDPNEPGGMLMMGNDMFQTKGQTLKSIMKFAYNLNMGAEQQISGGPSWVDSAKFDIQAKEAPETIEAFKKLTRDQRTDQIRLMVQALLGERFQLKLHHETKPLPVYSLVVAKGGVKMTPAPDDPSAAQAPQPGSGPGKLMPHGIRLAGRGEIDGMGATAAMFSNVIGRQPEIGGRMVVDNTGLTGNYNFTLKWTPDLGGGASGPDGGGAAPDPTGPSLFTAIQEQLGLKLDATKAPVDTLVIDSVEMPSGN